MNRNSKEPKDVRYYEIYLEQALVQEDTGNIFEAYEDFSGCVSKKLYFKILNLIRKKIK